MDPVSILIFIILILCSAFFSGTEIALMTTSKPTVASLLREGRFGAESLSKIKGNTDRLLITILIGNNIVNTASAALATSAALTLAANSGLPKETGMMIATVIVTVLLLFFGEITPKTICTRYNVQISLLVAPIYRVLIFIFTPIAILMEFFLKGVMWIFGGDGAKSISYQEVEAFIDMSHEEWEVEDDERRQMKNLLSLRDMSAESVMTPRVNVDFLSNKMTIDEVCDFMMNCPHSRLPVYGESTDDVSFILTFREAFKLKSEGHGSSKLEDLDLEKIMKVPLTQALDDLFEKFQKSRRHIALVVDEHGGTAGVVTMEDILEEVFGDIKDETDKEEIFMRKKQNGNIEVVGSLLIDDVLEEFNLHFDDINLKEEYRNEPISYIIMAEKESFPVVGDEVILGETVQIKLRVTTIDETVITHVECEKL